MKKIAFVLVWLAGWAWAFLAGVGGLMLLIHEGPLPITNGWFAMFSGMAACPSTPTLLEKYGGLTVSGWTQFAVAFVIFLAGRVAVVFVLHRPFLPPGLAWGCAIVLIAAGVIALGSRTAK